MKKKKSLPKTAIVNLAFAPADGPSYKRGTLDGFWNAVSHADQISDSIGVRASMRSFTDIFLPEAGIRPCRITIEDTDEITDQADCELFGFHAGIPWKYRLTVEAAPDDVKEAVRKACSLLGLQCCVVEEYGDDIAFVSALMPDPGTVPEPIEKIIRPVPGTESEETA